MIPYVYVSVYPLEKWFATYFECDWLISKFVQFFGAGLGSCGRTEKISGKTPHDDIHLRKSSAHNPGFTLQT